MPVSPDARKIPVLVLFGPTASGKTALLEELFIRAPYCPAEIISADSMQVYRGMDIGTAKPSRAEQARIPHHLIDIINPSEQLNAGEFVRLAGAAILQATERSALPIVSGGTGFYIKNLIMGLPAAPPSDAVTRSALKEERARFGIEPLVKELAQKDPASAARIHANDEYRLLRALEVIRLTGKPLSAFAQNSNAEDSSRFRFLVLGIKRGREDLYRRVNERAAAMFRAGLAVEVKGLFDQGYTPRDPGMRAIGYREFFVEVPREQTAAGAADYALSTNLAAVEALVAQNSRRYAKRQMVFFASIPEVVWIEEPDTQKAADLVRAKLDAFLG